ncbi:MAG: hypothetical protein ACOC12_09930, partial [Bacteroidota bacterium]
MTAQWPKDKNKSAAMKWQFKENSVMTAQGQTFLKMGQKSRKFSDPLFRRLKPTAMGILLYKEDKVSQSDIAPL